MASNDGSAARPGWVYLVGAGPGDPGLLTTRGRQLLVTADVVLHDELVHPDLPRLALPRAEVRSVGKRGSSTSDKSANQTAINQLMVTEAKAGRSVVRLKGGDPFLFGRASEETAALRKAGVRFAVVPGVCAPLAATAYAGVPLTHRTHASAVTFVTAVMRDGNDYPWSQLNGLSGTVCVFMGRRRVAAICKGLVAESGLAAETPAMAIERISYGDQRTVVATLATLAEECERKNIGTPTLLVVGSTVAARSDNRWFERQPLFGKRIIVTRPPHQAAATVSALRLRGAIPIPIATIIIGPPESGAALDDALANLDRYDVLVFTSANGVDRFFHALKAANLDSRSLGNTQVAVIGPATGRALEKFGIVADVMGETYVAEGLVDAMTKQLKGNSRVLLPRATVAREYLPTALRALGMTVDVVPTYLTQWASQADDADARREQLLKHLKTADAITFTSSSTVSSTCDLLGSGAPRALESVLVASIGPVTTKTAVSRGLKVGLSSETSTIDALVDDLERYFTEAKNG